MDLSNKNRHLFIDEEALSALDTLKSGLLHPITALMNEEETKSVIQTKMFKGVSFPFPFILAPSGKRNLEVLKTAQKGEVLDLLIQREKVGTLVVEEVYSIDPQERIKHIFKTSNPNIKEVSTTLNRLGTLAISGPYSLMIEKYSKRQYKVIEAKKKVGAKHTTAIMLNANPLHRAHERLIRHALDSTDLIVLFLLKPFVKKDLKFSIRKSTVEYFIKNYLPKDKIIIIPLEYSYIYAGQDETIIDALVAKNFGCNSLMLGRKHVSSNYSTKDKQFSIVDTIIGNNITISLIDEYVFCDICKTFVSNSSCPHGQHQHILYHSKTILELLKQGIMPPTVLIRKEISAIILSKLFPNRFKNLENIYYQIIPNSGLLEDHDEEDFYKKLMELYQTTSLN
jgi:sulfate adenylyltransferase